MNNIFLLISEWYFSYIYYIFDLTQLISSVYKQIVWNRIHFDNTLTIAWLLVLNILLKAHNI